MKMWKSDENTIKSNKNRVSQICEGTASWFTLGSHFDAFSVEMDTKFRIYWEFQAILKDDLFLEGLKGGQDDIRSETETFWVPCGRERTEVAYRENVDVGSMMGLLTRPFLFFSRWPGTSLRRALFLFARSVGCARTAIVILNFVLSLFSSGNHVYSD